MPKKFALRSARSGSGVLPPNPRQWENEHNALDVRHELGLPLDVQLDHECAFDLLTNVWVLPHSALQLTETVTGHFSGPRSNRWSGMCVPCPTGQTLVLYNAHQPIHRIRATLMEEFFHIWLEHPPTKLRILPNQPSTRDFDAAKETEAFGSGAAALVPYKSLREMIKAKRTIYDISEHFNVSKQLVEFRVKVTRLGRLFAGCRS